MWLLVMSAYGQVKIYSHHISLDSVVNSAADEQNVIISPDGKLLYFTRKNHPENTGGPSDPGDIWVSERNENGDWTSAYNLRSINNQKNNIIIGLTNAGRTMIMRDGHQFAIANKNGGKWSTPQPFEVPYFKSKSKEFSASISADGRYLLFGMESFGSYGVEDIYVSQRQSDHSWSNPKSLGRQINTAYQEITPFLAADNKTLFFASNGYDGEGSFDIYVSVRLDDSWQNWSTPVNLGAKVNTPGRERSFSFLQDDEFAYLSSTQNSDGYGDIKKVKIVPNIIPEQVLVDSLIKSVEDSQEKLLAIRGQVFDKKSGQKLIGAEISIVTEPTQTEVRTLTNSTGHFTASVSEGDSYEIKIRAYRYLSVEEIVTENQLLNSDTLIFNMEPIIEGNTVTLNHVLFEQGKAILIEGSQKELDLVVEMMKYNPDISIFLAGHTDNQGKASLNVELSQDRVQTVTDYLISHGIDKKRISGKGYGGTRPIASNASIETRKLNRRVEFTVHEMKKPRN